MIDKIEQQLVDNISQLLKRSIVADSAIMELRESKIGNFKAIFAQDAGFKCSANTFQPYIQEVADEFLLWQQLKQQQLLIDLVKKIEKLFKVMGEFESHYQQK